MGVKEQILDVVIAELTRVGPVDFRIDAITAATGLSVGGIYHHFSNRDGLLRAAYAKVVRDVAEFDAGVLQTIFTTCATPAEVLEGVAMLTAVSQSPDRREARWLRLEAIQITMANAHIEAFSEMKRRGWLRADVDPYYLYLTISGNTMSTVQDDMGLQRLDVETWTKHTVNLFLPFVVDIGA